MTDTRQLWRWDRALFEMGTGLVLAVHQYMAQRLVPFMFVRRDIVIEETPLYPPVSSVCRKPLLRSVYRVHCFKLMLTYDGKGNLLFLASMALVLTEQSLLL